jgi:Flp pilus assembly protein TadD
VVDAFVRRGVARAAAGDDSGAQADFREALVIHPGCVEAYYGRGFVRERLGDFPGALSDYGDAIALEPGLAEAHDRRAHVLSHSGDREAARSAARTASSLYDAAGRRAEAAAARELERALTPR